MKTFDIIIKRGVALQGEPPDFAHLESPHGEVHRVSEPFGWALVLDGRATPADPAARPPTGINTDTLEPDAGAFGARNRLTFP